MSAVAALALGTLLVAAALLVVAVLRGPSLADRIVAAAPVSSVLAAGLAVDFARDRDPVFIDTLLVITVTGFLASLTAARYLESQR